MLAYHLKLWADPWQNHPGEVKGGQVALTYDTLIVTSNYSPEQCFSGVDLAAIQRRFTVEVFKKLNDHHTDTKEEPSEDKGNLWVNNNASYFEDLGF